MQNEPSTSAIANFRLLSDAIEGLCSARTPEEVVRIAARVARKACGADSISIVMVSGEQFHYAPEARPDTILQTVRSKVITRMAAWALEAGQTAVVPDIHRDERTRSHTNGSTFARSLVAVPTGASTPFGAITFAWGQEHWPLAPDVLMLETIARVTGLALTYTLSHTQDVDLEQADSVSEWLGTAADAEGLRGAERRHWVEVVQLQHRVRNVLGLVRSLVRRTASTSAADFSSRLEGRIDALARTQSFIMRRPGTGVEIEELVNAELFAHAARGAQVSAAGPPVRLRAKAAETLGLALHELATNAAKFGALSTSEGRLSITWRKEVDREDPCVRFEWVETGVTGLAEPGKQPAHRGFGRDLLEHTVPYELRGASRLSFEPGGVRCVIDIPLTADNIQ